jgi:hypothetical protein
VGGERDSQEIYFLDQGGFPQAADGPGSYEFRLEGGPRDDIPLMVAVATSGGVETGVAILHEWKLSDGPLRLQVKLDEAEPFDEMGSKRGVRVWHAGTASCVAAERAPGDVVFVVSPEDPTATALPTSSPAPNTECNPLVWNSIELADPFAASCVMENARSECLVGVSGCVDGPGQQACALTNLCLSEPLCTACNGNGMLPSCLDETRTDQLAIGTLAHVDCRVTGAEDGAGFVPCDMTNEAASASIRRRAVHRQQYETVLFAPPKPPAPMSSLPSELHLRPARMVTDHPDPHRRERATPMQVRPALADAEPDLGGRRPDLRDHDRVSREESERWPESRAPDAAHGEIRCLRRRAHPRRMRVPG